MSRLALRAVSRLRALPLLVLLLLPGALAAQDSLAKAEFAARRTKLIAMIPDGIAVILDFYYLTEIEEPAQCSS